ncbi:MAG: DUF115 domain-containing protein [Treponema sp.]|nr:DUF115 domain-containing protein [Treponema sp.]
MDRKYFFERNLLALSRRNPVLCSRLSAAETTLECYKFLDSLSGELIPAFVDRAGSAHALHSTVDPVKEAGRLVATLKDKNGLSTESFVIFLGLGAGFAPLAALNSGDAAHVLVIDYDINGIAELFCSREYIAFLGDPRFTLLVDPSADLIESAILEIYKPALCGGIRVLPLRARTEQDKQKFGIAGDTIQRTIEKVSQDYSVQAHFGMRWFSNIIRNLESAQQQNRSARPVREAAICAAGPSLDEQIPLLLEQRERSRELFVIAADTALPALLHRGLKPDAIVSIDCQHISYYHFMGTGCADIPLFLDIASPPMLSGFSACPFFFSGGHPLAVYLSQQWRPLPLLDTSGGNVTYACLSLAESLSAQRITVYGADFSYPAGKVYARGTYIYPFFAQKQKRLAPLEAHFSSFLYRSPFLSPEADTNVDETALRYETTALRLYRKHFERKMAGMEALVRSAPGLGIPFSNGRESEQVHHFHPSTKRIFSLFAPGKARMSADQFLEQYRQDIAALPVRALPAHNLDAAEKRILTTLLPQAAAIKHRRPELTTPELIEAVKSYCVNEIDKVLREMRNEE